MLADSNLDLSLWDFAFETASALRNMVPNTKNFKSPDELFLGQKPSIKKLKPFGSKVFYKVNSKKDLKKLEHRAREAIYLNFDQNTQCYKLIDVMD